jgi:hypothetical protein
MTETPTVRRAGQLSSGMGELPLRRRDDGSSRVARHPDACSSVATERLRHEQARSAAALIEVDGRETR